MTAAKMSASVILVWCLAMTKRGASLRIRVPQVIGRVAKTPHPVPVDDGFSLKGVLRGRRRLR